MARIISFVLIVLLAFSCGDVCPGGKNTTELPAGFEEPVQGLITHSEWVYTSGNQEVDTLTALDSFRKNYTQSDCSLKEFGVRNFRWTLLKDCESEEMVLGLGLNNTDKMRLDLIPSTRNTACFNVSLDYEVSSIEFQDTIQVLAEFTTPLQIYKNTMVLPFRFGSHPEALFYVPDDGIVGYTSDTDTFRLKSLK